MLHRTSGLGPAELFAVVQVAAGLALLPLPKSARAHETELVLLEDIIACKLSELFGGYDSAYQATFRLTRDMDVDKASSQESDDMLRAIEARLEVRQHLEAVRLEVHKEMSRDLLDTLVSEEQLPENFFVEGENTSRSTASTACST